MAFDSRREATRTHPSSPEQSASTPTSPLGERMPTALSAAAGSLVMWMVDGETYALLDFPADVSPRSYLIKQLGLSLAEGDVVGLAVRGLRNVEIAGLRKVSPRTVRNQLAACYAKLGVGSRSELAARFPWLGEDDGSVFGARGC